MAADAPPPGLGCFLSRPPAVLLSAGGDNRISQVPAQTLCRPAHAPSTPDRPAGTRLDAPADAATGQGTAVALSMDFRGSIAWLDRLLSTLQSAGSPRHHARLASHLRGYALVGGLRTRWVCSERFQLCVSCHIAFSFRELAWRNPRFIPRLLRICVRICVRICLQCRRSRFKLGRFSGVLSV